MLLKIKELLSSNEFQTNQSNCGMYLRPMYLEPVEHGLCILHEDPAQDFFGRNPGAINVLLDHAMW